MKKTNLLWMILGSIVVFIMYCISVEMRHRREAAGYKNIAVGMDSQDDTTIGWLCPSHGASDTSKFGGISGDDISPFYSIDSDVTITTTGTITMDSSLFYEYEPRTPNIPKYIPDTVPYNMIGGTIITTGTKNLPIGAGSMGYVLPSTSGTFPIAIGYPSWATPEKDTTPWYKRNYSFTNPQK